MARIAGLSIEGLEAEHRRLGLLGAGKVLQRAELEQPLRTVAIWRQLPLRELQRECEERGLDAEYLDVAGDREELHQKLLEELLVTLSADTLGHRGIPVKLLGSVEAAAKVAEQWDRLDRLSGKFLRDECACMGLPADACMEFLGHSTIVSRLKSHAIWQELPLPALHEECRERSVPLTGLSVMKVEVLHRELLDRLFIHLFADVYEERSGVPLRQLGSFGSANTVLKRWQVLQEMSIAELREEFRTKCGLYPEEAVPQSVLEGRLKDASVWAELPLKNLRDVCQMQGITPSAQIGTEEEKRQECIEHLLHSMCAHLWRSLGIDLKALGSFGRAMKLKAQWERYDQMKDFELLAEYGSQDLPAVEPKNAHEVRRRLRTMAYWRLVPTSELKRECERFGLSSFVPVPSDREELVKRLSAKLGSRAAEDRQRPPQRPRTPSPPPPREEKAKPKPKANQPRPKTSSKPKAEGPTPRPRQPKLPPVFEQHLQTLLLPPGASVDEIKRAYRRLALQYHPDKNTQTSRESSTAQFRKVAEAYEALLDFFQVAK